MSTVARTEILLLWMQAESGCCTRRIRFSAGGGLHDIAFTYDETKHLLRPEATRALEDDEYAGCMPKWWGWFFGITWGGLVCVPATAGASGVATPIAGAVTEMACAAAGGALVTAISC